MSLMSHECVELVSSEKKNGEKEKKLLRARHDVRNMNKLLIK